MPFASAARADSDTDLAADHALRLLAAAGAFARMEGTIALVFSRPRGVTLRTGSTAAAVIRALASDGAVERGSARGETFVLSDAGRARLRRLSAADPTAQAHGGARPDRGSFTTQHAELAAMQLAPEVQAVVNVAESPLLWLQRRGALPGDAEFAAGERLRSDMTIARTLPRMGVDLERPPGSGVAIGMDPSEARIAASQRVRSALKAVGPELSGVLVDVCGFLKGLEQVERERGWPKRSAKLVLGLGLGALARHYGLSNVAIGAGRRGRQHASPALPRGVFVVETAAVPAVGALPSRA